MLGWRSRIGIAMLWGMFDESYEHDRVTGHATRVTMGGCVGSFEAWQCFTLDWAKALEMVGIEMFHMADFEANQGEFRGWGDDQPKRRRLLAHLLDILTEYVTVYIGAEARVETPGDPTREIYRKLVIDCLKNAARDVGYRGEQKMAIVFARHRDFSVEKALAYKAVVDSFEPIFGPITVDDPLRMCPLQAADIVAYEMSRIQRPGAPERYPFCRLRDAARAAGTPFTISSRP